MSIMTAKQAMKARVAMEKKRFGSLAVVLAAIPSVRINRPLTWSQNKKAAGQDRAHARKGLIGSFA
jgi:hypothetical protein